MILIFCHIVELISPSDLSMDEGAVESFNFCFGVTEDVNVFIFRQIAIDTFPGVGTAKGIIII